MAGCMLDGGGLLPGCSVPSRICLRATSMRNRPRANALRLVRLEDRLAPAIWDGGGLNNLWSTPANWVGNLPPQPGEDVIFPFGAARQSNFNDFPIGTAFNSIAIEAGGYQINGKDVVLLDGVTGTIGANTSSAIALNLGGAGGLAKNGSGRVILSGDN